MNADEYIRKKTQQYESKKQEALDRFEERAINASIAYKGQRNGEITWHKHKAQLDVFFEELTDKIPDYCKQLTVVCDHRNNNADTALNGQLNSQLIDNRLLGIYDVSQECTRYECKLWNKGLRKKLLIHEMVFLCRRNEVWCYMTDDDESFKYVAGFCAECAEIVMKETQKLVLEAFKVNLVEKGKKVGELAKRIENITSLVESFTDCRSISLGWTNYNGGTCSPITIGNPDIC
jgi:hypothetical protein